MAVTKIKGSWWVAFMYSGERLRKRSPLNTRAGAVEFEIFLRQLVGKHGSVAEALKTMVPKTEDRALTFAQFAEQWFQDYALTNNKPSEQRAKRNALHNHLIPFLGEKALHEINNRLVEQLKSALLAKGLCRKSINNYLCVLHTCLAYAMEWEILAALPLIKPFKVKPPPFTYLPANEIDALVGTTPPGLLRAMIVVALYTGARYCELVALRWEDVNLEARQLRICRAEVRGVVGTTKSGQTRYVPISDQVLAVFDALPRDATLVFHRNGRSVRYVCALEALRDACSHAGVRHSSWHTLRHTFASMLVQRRVPLVVIRDLLGHSTVKMTERYAHLNDEPGRQAISMLDTAASAMTAGCQPELVALLQQLLAAQRSPAILGQDTQKAPPRGDAFHMVGVDGVEPDQTASDPTRSESIPGLSRATF